MVILERLVAATTCRIRSSFILRLRKLFPHTMHLRIGTLFLPEPIGPAQAMAAGSRVPRMDTMRISSNGPPKYSEASEDARLDRTRAAVLDSPCDRARAFAFEPSNDPSAELAHRLPSTQLSIATRNPSHFGTLPVTRSIQMFNIYDRLGFHHAQSCRIGPEWRPYCSLITFSAQGRFRKTCERPCVRNQADYEMNNAVLAR